MAASDDSGGGGGGGASSSEDMYDFSGVSLDDLSLMRTGLLMATGGMVATTFAGSSAAGGGDDDEEWYPPTPPPYDVLDRLIEANRDLYEDPNSLIHVPGKLRWRPDER